MKKYDFRVVEKKWQDTWEAEKTYRANDSSKKEKKYILIEFPYPSGEGLHMGHLRPYVAGDVFSRFMRMQDKEVLYPIGWDAFGLPAENYAIKNGVHPAISTAKNVANAKNQLQSWGIGFDWSREVNTTDPAYYRWTQWIFLKFFRAGLAYEATGYINWCPKDKTGLANEEVVNGCCERCGTKVEKKELRQWYLKITAYAEKLLEGLKHLSWPESIKLQQENWIGRSEGAEITFHIQTSDTKKDLNTVTVFTTRPDTLCGATYLVLSPEHELVTTLRPHISNIKDAEAYIARASAKSQEERMENKEKTGVRLEGIYAVNPVDKKEIPIFIADYVLSGYGTGAIMAVPAHDERDFEFATKFNIPIIEVISNSEKTDKTLYTGQGKLINSGEFDGMDSEEAKKKITEYVGGKMTVQYRLRDWVFSRQRYWGEPIPLIHCEKCGVVPVPEEELPVRLPDVQKYEPTGTGESPLAGIDSWVNTKCPSCGGPAKRETNTMPQWAGSSWYYARYTDPKNDREFANIHALKYWLPVDTYFGGAEHTTLHLLYSRFWHQFLFDQKLVPTPEPYALRVPHGIILGPDGEKMSKSRGNVVNPDVIVKEFGADALRMYELFLGPHEATVSWNEKGILGIERFLDRAYEFLNAKDGEEDEKTKRALHAAIRKVGDDISLFKFNTAVSALMIFLNTAEGKPASQETKKSFAKILAPFAPHLAEEMWRTWGEKDSIHHSLWPVYDKKLAEGETFTLVVQINGKVRAQIEVSKSISEAEAKEQACAHPAVQKIMGGTEPKKIIYVPGRLVSIVV